MLPSFLRWRCNGEEGGEREPHNLWRTGKGTRSFECNTFLAHGIRTNRQGR